MALKMGVCLSEASFAHLAMTDILKGMGVSGGRLFLGSFFFGGTKKNEQRRVSGTVPAFCPHRKKKYIAYVNGKFTKKIGQRDIFPWKSTHADVNGTFTEQKNLLHKKQFLMEQIIYYI